MIYIIISKTAEHSDLSHKEWEAKLINGSIVPSQKEYLEISKEFKLNKNVQIIDSEIFSYQNQGNPTKDDTVILVNGSDRYDYEKIGFKLYEFNTYNDNLYDIEKIKKIVNGGNEMNDYGSELLIKALEASKNMNIDDYINDDEKYKRLKDLLLVSNMSQIEETLKKTVEIVGGLNERLTKAESEIVMLRLEKNVLKNEIGKLKGDK